MYSVQKKYLFSFPCEMTVVQNGHPNRPFTISYKFKVTVSDSVVILFRCNFRKRRSWTFPLANNIATVFIITYSNIEFKMESVPSKPNMEVVYIHLWRDLCFQERRHKKLFLPLKHPPFLLLRPQRPLANTTRHGTGVELSNGGQQDRDSMEHFYHKKFQGQQEVQKK